MMFIAFVGGVLVGSGLTFIMFALCAAAATRDEIWVEEDPCYGCFGASMNDCGECPKMRKDGEPDAGHEEK